MREGKSKLLDVMYFRKLPSSYYLNVSFYMWYQWFLNNVSFKRSFFLETFEETTFTPYTNMYADSSMQMAVEKLTLLPSHCVLCGPGWKIADPNRKRYRNICTINQMFIYLRCLHPINFSCFHFVNQMFIVHYWEI